MHDAYINGYGAQAYQTMLLFVHSVALVKQVGAMNGAIRSKGFEVLSKS